jgi:hypothetical protein
MESKKINQLATEMSPASSDLTIIGDPITGVSKKVTLEQISSLFASSISFYTNYASFPATGSIDTLYCAKDTNKLYLWSGSAYVETFPSQALLDTYQLRSEKGNANGYASLDGSGKVPSTQLPSYVDDVIEVANYASLPVTGETGKIYITLDNNKIYRWSGSVYVEIASNNAIWGSITGTLSNQTDLQNALNAKVPYTGATANVNLGTFDLTADIITGAKGSFASNGGSDTFAINHSSGSGISLNITKGGNGEGLYINKTSGSGNAATIIGTLNATTLVKSGGTSSQFLKADGSVDSGSYISLTSLSATSPLSYNNTTGAFSISKADDIRDGYLSSADWTTFNNKQNALTNPITGTGANGRIAYFNGTTTQTSSANLTWDNTDSILSTKSILATTDVAAYNLTINNEDFGKIQNVTDRSWSLAYSSGGSANALGNSALVWNYLGNVIVINKLSVGNYNTTYNLDITGTARFTGQLTLGSTITNGTNTYTLPSATGTLALTGDLSGYLPLTGGTLTGALIGTSASFSSNVAVGTTSAGANVNVYSSSYGANGLFQAFGTDNAMKLQMGALGNSEAYIYANTGCKLSLFSGGNTTMTLTSGGNVGIGTTSPTTVTNYIVQTINGTSGSFTEYQQGGSYAFRIGSDSSLGGFLNQTDANPIRFFINSGERMRITSGGLLLIGTTSTSGVDRVRVNNDGTTSYSTVNITNANSTANMYVGVGGSNVANGNLRNNAYVWNAAASDLLLGTSDTERMRITSTGLVGIGTTAPTAALTVSGFNVGAAIDWTNTTATTGRTYRWVSLNSGGFAIEDITGGGLKMVIASSGNVGIGVTSPTYAIDVLTSGAQAARFAVSGTNLYTAYRANSVDVGYIGNGVGTVSGGTATDFGFLATTNMVFATGSALERMRITSGGAVLVGKTTKSTFTSATTIEVRGEFVADGSDAGVFFENRASTGTMYGWYGVSNAIYLYNSAVGNIGLFAPSNGGYTALSDINKKKDFEDSTIGLNAILGLKPTLYRMKSDSNDVPKQLGFIAQEVKEFIPQAYVEQNDFIGLNDRPIIAALVKAVQELKAEIDELKNK